MFVKLKVITVGDKTTTGGTVENGALTVFCRSRLVALIGSESFCPQCKTLGVIRKTKPFNVFAENKQVCLEMMWLNVAVLSVLTASLLPLMPLSLLVMKTVRSVPPFLMERYPILFRTGETQCSARGRKNQNNTRRLRRNKTVLLTPVSQKITRY